MREPFGCWGGQPKKQELLKKTYHLTPKSSNSQRENRIEKEIERNLTLTLCVIGWLKIQLFFNNLLAKTEQPTPSSLCDITPWWCFVAELLPYLERCCLLFLRSFSSQCHFSLSHFTQQSHHTTYTRNSFLIFILFYIPHPTTTHLSILFLFLSTLLIFLSYLTTHWIFLLFFLKSPLLTFCPHAHSPHSTETCFHYYCYYFCCFFERQIEIK